MYALLTSEICYEVTYISKLSSSFMVNAYFAVHFGHHLLLKFFLFFKNYRSM